MPYNNLLHELLNKGLIKKQEPDFAQMKNHLNRAKKDLIVAKHNLKFDEEVSYNYAYLAMLRCGRTLMFLNGYRPIDGQQHKTVIEFADIILGKEFKELIKRFDVMRRKRNQFTYEPLSPVSKVEAENALNCAEEFVTKIIKVVKKENPQLELDF